MSISFSHIAKTVPKKADVCPINKEKTEFSLNEKKIFESFKNSSENAGRLSYRQRENQTHPQEGEHHGTNPKHRVAHHCPL